MKMTLSEAAYCMRSYLPENNVEHCIQCPYYASEGFDLQAKTCKSSEAHTLANASLNAWISVVAEIKRYQDPEKKDGQFDRALNLCLKIIENHLKREVLTTLGSKDPVEGLHLDLHDLLIDYTSESDAWDRVDEIIEKYKDTLRS